MAEREISNPFERGDRVHFPPVDRDGSLFDEPAADDESDLNLTIGTQSAANRLHIPEEPFHRFQEAERDASAAADSSGAHDDPVSDALLRDQQYFRAHMNEDDDDDDAGGEAARPPVVLYDPEVDRVVANGRGKVTRCAQTTWSLGPAANLQTTGEAEGEGEDDEDDMGDYDGDEMDSVNLHDRSTDSAHSAMDFVVQDEPSHSPDRPAIPSGAHGHLAVPRLTVIPPGSVPASTIMEVDETDMLTPRVGPAGGAPRTGGGVRSSVEEDAGFLLRTPLFSPIMRPSRRSPMQPSRRTPFATPSSTTKRRPQRLGDADGHPIRSASGLTSPAAAAGARHRNSRPAIAVAKAAESPPLGRVTGAVGVNGVPIISGPVSSPPLPSRDDDGISGGRAGQPRGSADAELQAARVALSPVAIPRHDQSPVGASSQARTPMPQRSRDIQSNDDADLLELGSVVENVEREMGGRRASSNGSRRDDEGEEAAVLDRSVYKQLDFAVRAGQFEERFIRGKNRDYVLLMPTGRRRKGTAGSRHRLGRGSVRRRFREGEILDDSDDEEEEESDGEDIIGVDGFGPSARSSLGLRGKPVSIFRPRRRRRRRSRNRSSVDDRSQLLSTGRAPASSNASAAEADVEAPTADPSPSATTTTTSTVGHPTATGMMTFLPSNVTTSSHQCPHCHSPFFVISSPQPPSASPSMTRYGVGRSSTVTGATASPHYPLLASLNQGRRSHQIPSTAGRRYATVVDGIDTRVRHRRAPLRQPRFPARGMGSPSSFQDHPRLVPAGRTTTTSRSGEFGSHYGTTVGGGLLGDSRRSRDYRNPSFSSSSGYLMEQQRRSQRTPASPLAGSPLSQHNYEYLKQRYNSQMKEFERRNHFM